MCVWGENESACFVTRTKEVKGRLLTFSSLGQGKETAGFAVGTMWKGGKQSMMFGIGEICKLGKWKRNWMVDLGEDAVRDCAEREDSTERNRNSWGKEQNPKWPLLLMGNQNLVTKWDARTAKLKWRSWCTGCTSRCRWEHESNNGFNSTAQTQTKEPTWITSCAT